MTNYVDVLRWRVQVRDQRDYKVWRSGHNEYETPEAALNAAAEYICAHPGAVFRLIYFKRAVQTSTEALF